MQETKTEEPSASKVAHTGYRVIVEPNAQRVRAIVDGITIADSTRAMVMRETRLPHVFYFPRDDVRMDLMTRTDHRTHCPFKGNASYWTLAAGNRQVANAVWSYEDPYDESSSVQNYVAIDWKAVDTWYGDDEAIVEQPIDPGSTQENPFCRLAHSGSLASQVRFQTSCGSSLTPLSGSGFRCGECACWFER